MTESAVFFNGNKQGDAQLYVSSDVSTSGDAATFDLFVDVKDGSEVEQVYTQSNLMWNSQDGNWLDSGE